MYGYLEHKISRELMVLLPFGLGLNHIQINQISHSTVWKFELQR